MPTFLWEDPRTTPPLWALPPPPVTLALGSLSPSSAPELGSDYFAAPAGLVSALRGSLLAHLLPADR